MCRLVAKTTVVLGVISSHTKVFLEKQRVCLTGVEKLAPKSQRMRFQGCRSEPAGGRSLDSCQAWAGPGHGLFSSLESPRDAHLQGLLLRHCSLPLLQGKHPWQNHKASGAFPDMMWEIHTHKEGFTYRNRGWNKALLMGCLNQLSWFQRASINLYSYPLRKHWIQMKKIPNFIIRFKICLQNPLEVIILSRTLTKLI